MAINQLETSLNFIESRLGKNLAEITSVDLSKNSAEDLVLCLNSLRENSFVVNISLHGAFSFFRSLDYVRSFAELLRVNHTITSIHLRSNRINDEQLQLLVEALKQNNKNKISLLNLESNNIGCRGAEHIAEFLVRNECKLNHLSLARNKLNDEAMKCLSYALKNNSTLTTLYLNNCCIDDKGAEYLSEAIKNNHTLISLNLDENLINSRGGRFLAGALFVNDSITMFSIQSNPIADVYDLFPYVIRENNRLKTVRLGNDMSPHACYCGQYYEAFMQNNHIDHIDFSNFVLEAGIHNVLRPILMKPSITSINLRSSSMLPLDVISYVLSNNSSINFIDLKNCRINDAGIRMLAPAISRSKLATLVLSANSFGKEGAECLLQALNLNHTITSLDEENRESIFLNNIGANILSALRIILNRNKVIQDRLSLNWAKICICIAFIRANRHNFFGEPLNASLLEIILRVSGLSINQQPMITSRGLNADIAGIRQAEGSISEKSHENIQGNFPSLLSAYGNHKNSVEPTTALGTKTGTRGCTEGMLAKQIGAFLGLKERCEASSITSTWHGLRFSERTSWAQIQGYAKILNERGINVSLKEPYTSSTIFISGGIDIRGTLEDSAERLARGASSVNPI